MTTTPLTKRPALRIVLLLACGILASTYVPLSPLTFYFTTLLFALVGFALQLGTRSILAASISIHVGIVCAGAALYTNELSKSSTEKLVPQGRNELIVLEGTVDAEPVEKGKNLQLVVRTTFIARGPEAAATDRRVLVLAKTSKNKELRERTQIGTSVVVEGLLEDFPGPRNPGEFNYGRYLELDDIDGVVRVNDSGGVRIGGAPQKTSLLSSISTLRRSLAAILDRHHSGEEASYLKGLVLADRGEIPTEVKQSFVDTGTIHILAVSGLHVAVVAMIFYGLFGMLRFPRRLVSIATMAGLIFYMLLTGATPSVVRATIMACVLLAGGLFERKTDIYNSLGIAALIILALDPKQLFNVGFQLSFAAVVSIVYFYPILAQLIRRIPEKFEEIKAIDLVLKLFAVSLAAQLGTLPFTAFYFERISIVSLLANLVVVPISSVNVMLGFATILTSPISNWLAGCYAA
ncbi:MAG TPA: hypothetical protein DCP63_01680, partial [Bacteroidetes bacterium]|nr:hypothetical protein [Bacteroidota bacterium]